MPTKTYLNELSYKIIGCAIEVHKHFGPGLLESMYQMCFVEELKLQGLKVQSQVYYPVTYKSSNLGGTFKIDLIIEDEIIVELKAVEAMIPLFQAQLLSYLKLTGKTKGLLLNFNCEVIKEQVKSIVTENFRRLDWE